MKFRGLVAVERNPSVALLCPSVDLPAQAGLAEEERRRINLIEAQQLVTI